MEFTDVIQYLPKLSPAFLFIGVFIGLFYYKTIDKLHKSIFFYLLAMLLIDIVSRCLKYFYLSNHIILLIYSFIELLFFLFFYKNHLFSKKHTALVVTAFLGMGYIIGEIIYFFILNKTKPEQFQPYGKVVDNFIVILLALSFLYEKINSFKDSKWDNFRLNIVILIFFTLNMLIFLPFNFLVNENTGIKFYFWACNVILLLLFYGFLIGSIWINRKRNKPVSHTFNK